jgi:hypothetical protein
MNFAHRLTHNGLKLEYLNSICRWTPSNDIIFAFYGQSTLICGQCNDMFSSVSRAGQKQSAQNATLVKNQLAGKTKLT